jgi:hypothetical protein
MRKRTTGCRGSGRDKKVTAPLLVVVITPLSALALNAATEVKHPNLLLHREEIAQMRDKIAKYPWAADLFARTRDLSARSDAYPASAFGGVQVRAQALCYVITGERNYADQARAFLLHEARDDLPRLENRDPNLTVYEGLNIWQGAWCTYAWAYDLTYDTFRARRARSWCSAGCGRPATSSSTTTTTCRPPPT